MSEVRPAYERIKEVLIADARQGRCAREGRADARGKAGQMREARQSSCARQGMADERGKAG
jgi:hypothetical protein